MLSVTKFSTTVHYLNAPKITKKNPSLIHPLQFSGSPQDQQLPGSRKPVFLSFDLDSSLFKWREYNKSIDTGELKRVIDTIRQHRDQVTVAINTSRSLAAVKMLAPMFKGFPLDYLILYDGKTIFPKVDPLIPTEQWIRKLDFDQQQDSAWSQTVQWPVKKIVQIQDQILAEEGFQPFYDPQYAKRIGVKTMLQKTDEYGQRWVVLSSMSDMVTVLLISPSKEQEAKTRQYAQQLAEKISRRIQDNQLKAEPVCYPWPSPWGEMSFVFGGNLPHFNKASALDYLVRKFDRPRHIVSIGDSGNDREMLLKSDFQNAQGELVLNTPIYHNNFGPDDKLYSALSSNPNACIVAPIERLNSAQRAKQCADLPTALQNVLARLPETRNGKVIPLHFGSISRPWQQRQEEGRMVRPNHWYFPQQFVDMMEMLAERANMKSGAQYITRVLGRLMFKAYLEQHAEKPILESVETTIQGMHQGQPTNTQVKSLLGPRQILREWNRQVEGAKDYIQIALYDFDNVEVPGGRAVDGADLHDYWYWQQGLLQKLIEKARAFKEQGNGRKIQIILDASKEQERNEYGYLREFGNGKRYQINNENMVAWLRDTAKAERLPIEVVHYPRELAKLYHVKLLIVDGMKAIVGGMNMSNHSPANWDACVALEGPEVANLQAETFNQDWVVGRCVEQLHQGFSRPQIFHHLRKLKPEEYAPFMRELPGNVTPVSNPGIKVLNTIPSEYQAFNFKPREEIGDYLKQTMSDGNLQEVLGEQFILTHKGLTQKLLDRYKKGDLQVRMLHSLGVISQFPYTRKAVHRLYGQGGDHLLRYYKEFKETQEKLHAKLLLLNRRTPSKGNQKNQWEVFIGSSNLSKVGLETNVRDGTDRLDLDLAREVRTEREQENLQFVVENFKRQFPPEPLSALIRELRTILKPELKDGEKAQQFEQQLKREIMNSVGKRIAYKILKRERPDPEKVEVAKLAFLQELNQTAADLVKALIAKKAKQYGAAKLPPDLKTYYRTLTEQVKQQTEALMNTLGERFLYSYVDVDLNKLAAPLTEANQDADILIDPTVLYAYEYARKKSEHGHQLMYQNPDRALSGKYPPDAPTPEPQSEYSIEKALIVQQPWLDKILAGKKKWEIRGNNISTRGWIALAEPGSKGDEKGVRQIKGIAFLANVLGPLSQKQIYDNIRKHKIPKAFLNFYQGVRYAKPYAWVLQKAYRFPEPVTVPVKQGTITWFNLPEQTQRTLDKFLPEHVKKPIRK